VLPHENYREVSIISRETAGGWTAAKPGYRWKSHWFTGIAA